ncbi:helix-turn-helix transcriptional regulator [Paraburkholderia adhaesiva]|uniref:helix-turn-helix transcriptional regulator n=1 Tax=Paraburkholderia adhaesiva TaxID=2883244 RepID=UPI001F328E3F|nr:AlpA family phage regulatory protein [Paraburkholderia adhaesiva]
MIEDGPPPGCCEDLKIVGLDELRALLKVSARTVRRLERTDPDFPRGFRIGGRAHNWLLADVRAWLYRKAGKFPVV